VAHFAELRELRVARITRPSRYFLLVETGDEVLDYREAVAFYGGAWQYVRGGAITRSRTTRRSSRRSCASRASREPRRSSTAARARRATRARIMPPVCIHSSTQGAMHVRNSLDRP
jgi:hypothetical protein